MQAVPGGKPGPDVIARGGNNTWAPDVIRSGDKYFIYYSAPGTQPKSAIGLLVGSTLDPASPDYKWEDGGPVVWSDGVEDSNAIDPGVFRESRGRDSVFFVESAAEASGEVRNVFVNSVQHGRSGVMFSRSGRLETAPNGDRFIVLLDGRRYEGVPGEADYRVMEFERYAARVETSAADEPVPTHKSLSTLALARDPTPVNQAELVWRIGVPLSALILSLLAIPLSFVNPRAGRSVNLLFALLAYLVYYNTLTVSQARVAQGKLDFEVGWWLVHAVVLAALVLLFAQRMTLLRLRLRS